MTPIERIEEMRLRPEDDREIAGLLVRAFQEDFGGRSYHKQRHHLRLIWREQGRILGHMALCFRDIRLGDALVAIAGLGDVCTDPDHRGRGIAGALMKAVVVEAGEGAAEFLVLFGDRPLYAATGFTGFANVLRYVALDDARTDTVRTGVDEALMVLPLRGRAWDGTASVDLLGHLF